MLAADGVDEVLRVVFGGCPPWGQIKPEAGQTVRIAATDESRSWLVTLGRFTGTDPAGQAHDEPDIVIVPTDTGARSAATLTGTAADLDCYLWGRPPVGDVRRSGESEVLDRFTAILGQGAK